MAQEYKIIGQQVATTSLADMYTVPAATSVVVSTITVCNFSGSDTTFSIKTAPAGATDDDEHWDYCEVPIPAKETFNFTGGMTLGATDVVRIQAGDNDAVAIHIYGSVIT